MFLYLIPWAFPNKAGDLAEGVVTGVDLESHLSPSGFFLFVHSVLQKDGKLEPREAVREEDAL